MGQMIPAVFNRGILSNALTVLRGGAILLVSVQKRRTRNGRQRLKFASEVNWAACHAAKAEERTTIHQRTEADVFKPRPAAKAVRCAGAGSPMRAGGGCRTERWPVSSAACRNRTSVYICATAGGLSPFATVCNRRCVGAGPPRTPVSILKSSLFLSLFLGVPQSSLSFSLLLVELVHSGSCNLYVDLTKK